MEEREHANHWWAAWGKMAPRTSGCASGRLSHGKEVGKRVIVSSISGDKCWQIEQTLKVRYRRRTAMRGGRVLPEPDKTCIFELLLVRVLCVISHCRIPLHPEGANKTAIRQLPGSSKKKKYKNKRGCTNTPPPPPRALWLTPSTESRLHGPAHSSLAPGSGLTSPLTDYFEPFSGYIIASLSSSLYSPYRRSIAAKPQIESCNYPDCHLIASLFIGSITAGPANSSQGQRERKGLLVAQCATDSSSLWYIYSSSWVQSKLMHRGNFFFFMPTPSLQPDKDCSLSVLSLD